MSSVVFDTDPATFAAEVIPVLERDEAVNGLLLGMCAWLRLPNRNEKMLLSRLIDDRGATSAVGLQIADNNLILSEISGASIPMLVGAYGARGANFPGVDGPNETVSAFAEAWSLECGQAIKGCMNLMIYRLDALIRPRLCDGSLRPAEEADLPLLADWLEAYTVEVLPYDRFTAQERFAILQRRVRGGDIFVWQRGDRIVGMAGRTGPTPNGIRIMAVYVPSAERGQGIGVNLVAALCAHLFESGKRFCYLYADLDHDIPRKLYEAIGFRPVRRTSSLAFEPS